MNNFAAKNPVVQEGEMKFEIPRGGGPLRGGNRNCPIYLGGGDQTPLDTMRQMHRHTDT